MKKIILFLISSILLLGCSDDSTNPEEQDDFSGDSGTFVDERDGHEYKWVEIGNQVWMAENLAYLPKVNGSSEGSYSDSFFYVYGYDGTDISEARKVDNYTTYGVLYNWTAAKEACPEGWRLPTSTDWYFLQQYIDQDRQDFDYNVAYYLKTPNNWKSDGNGNNYYGFSLPPGGYRGYHGGFSAQKENASFWAYSTSRADNSDEADFLVFHWTHNRIGFVANDKSYGYSVRCIKD